MKRDELCIVIMNVKFRIIMTEMKKESQTGTNDNTFVLTIASTIAPRKIY